MRSQLLSRAACQSQTALRNLSPSTHYPAPDGLVLQALSRQALQSRASSCSSQSVARPWKLNAPIAARSWRSPLTPTSNSLRPHVCRSFTLTNSLLEKQEIGKATKSYRQEIRERRSKFNDQEEDNHSHEQEKDKDESLRTDEEFPEFGRSEKASQAAQLDLSARLSKDGSKGGTSGSFSEVWRLLKIAMPEKKSLGLAFVCLLISSGIGLTVPFSIGKVMDASTSTDGKDLPFGLTPITFYVALGTILTIGAVANFGRVIILRTVGERIVLRLRSSLYRRTFIQNAEFFDANRVGDLISRLSSDTVLVGKSITQNLSDGLRSAVSGIAGLAMMGYMSLQLTAVLLFSFPPVLAASLLYGRLIRDLSRKTQQNLGTLTKIAEERLGNVRTSQAFTGEVQEVRRYNSQVRKIFNLGKREAYISAVYFGSVPWFGNMTVIALLYVGGNLVRSGDMSLGDLTSFLMYTVYTGSSVLGLSGFYSELMKGVGAATRLFELQDRDTSLYPTKGDKVTSARGAIEFKHVGFSYPTRPAVSIFKDLNFRIEEGSNIAIVAPSGAGKSTVAQLLLRFYTPSNGTITIDGRDISKMNAKQLRRRIGYVGQEPVLFSGTIAENIAYGKPEATRAEIVQAARKANCQFISDFPDGLETHVGARGTQLSGGQKQRIAIARALLKQPDILILDEATSALDAESETLVNQALASLLAGHNTTISIAHRLSTIKRSDRIIVIGEGGVVTDEGSYAELSAKEGGAFNKLMEWQITGDPALAPSATAEKPSEEEIDDDMEHAEDGDKVSPTIADVIDEKPKEGGN